MKWQYFEKLVAFIFDNNDFEVKHNSVLKLGKTKRQFDVIAERFGTVFLPVKTTGQEKQRGCEKETNPSCNHIAIYRFMDVFILLLYLFVGRAAGNSRKDQEE